MRELGSACPESISTTVREETAKAEGAWRDFLAACEELARQGKIAYAREIGEIERRREWIRRRKAEIEGILLEHAIRNPAPHETN